MPLAVLLVVAAVTPPLEELLEDVDALQRVLVPRGSAGALASLEKMDVAAASSDVTGGGGGDNEQTGTTNAVSLQQQQQQQQREDVKCCVCSGLKDIWPGAPQDMCLQETQRGSWFERLLGLKKCRAACQSLRSEKEGEIEYQMDQARDGDGRGIKRSGSCAGATDLELCDAAINTAVAGRAADDAEARAAAAAVYAQKAKTDAEAAAAAARAEAAEAAATILTSPPASDAEDSDGSWSGGVQTIARNVFKKGLGNTVIGDCDFGYTGSRDANLNYAMMYRRAVALCGGRYMWLHMATGTTTPTLSVNRCTMADMFMGVEFTDTDDDGNAEEVDCKGSGRYGPRPYEEMLKLTERAAKRDLNFYVAKSGVGAGAGGGLRNLETGDMLDNPLYVIGQKPLEIASNVAKTSGVGARKTYGVAVCWQLAAAGITALIDAFKAAGGYEGTRIWWLREQYYNEDGEMDDGHEYLAISGPGVALNFKTAMRDLQAHEATVLVDYWYSAMSYDGTDASITVMPMSEADGRFTFANTFVAEDWLVEAQATKLMESGGLCGDEETDTREGTGEGDLQRKCKRVVMVS